LAHLNIIQEVKDQTQIISLEGDIDEDSKFDQFEFSNEPILKFNLEKVNNLNSYGARLWTSWLQNIPAQTQVIFQKCSDVVVHEMNRNAAFIPPNAKIESFYVPYFSKSLQSTMKVLFIQGTHFTGADVHLVQGHLHDVVLGGDYELDVIPEKYFRFLRRNT
jgi:hypothetical protein